MEVMLTIIKVFIIVFLLSLWENSSFNWVSRYTLLVLKLKGKERPFLEGCEKGEHIAILSPRALDCYKKWKRFSFCEISNSYPSFVFLVDPLANKHLRTWSSMINLWIDSRNLSVTLITLYLKVLRNMVSQNSSINF